MCVSTPGAVQMLMRSPAREQERERESEIEVEMIHCDTIIG